MLFLLLILFACEEETKNPLAVDDDGDGYSEFDGDCNDHDSNIYPGSVAEAIYLECMLDNDGDGFGDANAIDPFDAGTDCDDTNPYTFPGAAENESDTDCLTDSDEDGWSAETEDCDDNDSSSTVVSDDNDCDGVLSQ